MLHHPYVVAGVDSGLGALVIWLLSQANLTYFGVVLGVILAILRIIVTFKEMKDRSKKRDRRAGDRRHERSSRKTDGVVD